jgi:hypothetical protein
MFFATDIDIEEGYFSIVFAHHDMKLVLCTLTPKLIEVPIGNKGRINLGSPGSNLEWDEEDFGFNSDQGGNDALYFYVSTTPELMASFKTAAEEWNNKIAAYQGLQDGY